MRNAISPSPISYTYKLVLPVILLLMLFSGHAFAASCTAFYTYTANGGNATYTLAAGESLKINSGTFTGSINALPTGSSICVETGASFAPVIFNGIFGKLINYGTLDLQNYTYNTGVVFDNYGTLKFKGLSTNGAITLTNRANATMTMSEDFQLGMNSTLINDGLLIAQQDFNTTKGTSLTNNYRLEIEGNFNPDGKFDNYGRVYAKQFININVNSDVTNYCTLVSWGGFNNNSSLMDNQGTILITTSTGAPGGPWQNNQPFNNASGAKIAGGNFINNAAFTGGGFMIFSGDTRNQAAFDGKSAADKITFYDESQTGSQLFDIEWVTPTNTVRTAFTRPTELDAPATCTTSYKNFANPATYDYGDAPATYGNAGHIIAAGIQLGTLAPDSEAASQYTFNASGDGDDEDGAPHPVAPTGPAKAALFPVLKLTASSYTTPITVTNTTGTAGTLYGWIDFDKSGTFEADEASSVAVPTGSSNAKVNLTWSSIPADIKLGTTFIRLRLTTDTTVTTSTPTGIASNGEVEDYPIAIYQNIPPNSSSLKIVTGDTPLACQTKIFEDNFNDVPEIYWGANRAGSQDIRNWVRGGGGSNTYAAVEHIDATQKTAIYFGTGTMRGISPSIPTGFTFDANGKLTTALDAVALRDIPDDVSSITDEAIWGPYPVTLSRSFPTQIGKTYRLYFKAIPETDSSYVYSSGIMRVDITGSDTQSIHFKAPGSTEGTLDYAIEFTATAVTSTLTFVNYGHVDNGWCDPQQEAWCTIGGTTDGSNPNELIIDDVVLAEADCNNASISGTVYTDSNSNDSFDTGESGIASITIKLLNNADNSSIAATESAADGSYSFTGLDASLTYRIEVDTADVDLTDKTIGTTNPLTNVSVAAGATTANKDFGFDPAPTYGLSGTIFEDINYGGGAGRPFGTSGTTGISGATVELYNNAGQYLTRTSSTAGGNYSFGTVTGSKYYIRIVNDSVSSSRSGSNGSELAVQTYRSSDAGAVTNEVGGHNPAVADAPANTADLKLNTSTFKFSSGEQAQSVQVVTVAGDDVSGINFGFNFDTIVNTKDSGQGSLRQFLLNANLLGNDNTLAQAGLSAGKENAILLLPTTDPNYNTTAKYWSIALLSTLPEIKASLILDGSTQSGFTKNPVLELNGNGAGAGVNGLTLATGSNGSRISNLAINRFKGAGIYINGSNSNTLQANHIGTSPSGDTARGNGGSGILLNAASNNLIGDSTGVAGNLIANNGHDGVSITGAISNANTIMGNSIHTNTGIGIDLNDDSVTANDDEDLDNGPNALLNYPNVISTSFGANGSKIITYDFNLDLPNNTNGYRIDFYKNTSKDSTGFGEGQTWLGSKDFTHPGGGTLNYKGSFNANLSASSTEYIATTVTEKTGPISYGNTSEFSGATNNNSVIVCTDLLSNSSAALPDQVLDENAQVVSYLKAVDKNGNPLTYVISGGADANMFTVGEVTNGTTDCAQIRFVSSVIVKSAPNTPRALPPGFPNPGDYEVPMDSNGDNVYEIEITATDIDGVQYVRTLSTRIMDVNEAPIITSSTNISLEEDGSTQALDINAQDQDADDTEGNGLIYSLSGGADQAQFELETTTGILNFKTVPDYDAPTDSDQNNVYEVEVTVTDHGGLTESKVFNITVTNRTTDDGVKLKARAILQGAYDSTTGLMGNELNMLGLLPTNQPYAVSPFNYSGAEVLGTPTMSGIDNNAIVDWVLVDLRTSQNNIVTSRAVLVQRDGDLVDSLSGSPTLHFPNVVAGNYYVSVRHRNHLGVMTASPVSLSSTETLVDFSLTSTAVSGTATRYTSGNLAMLWVGDINGNGTLTSNGPSNDITNLLSTVITSNANPLAYTNFNLKGYLPSDLNMDGSTLFSGPNNDANILIGNVILHPLNSNFAANYIVRGGL